MSYDGFQIKFNNIYSNYMEVIRVSSKRPTGAYINDSKRVLREKGTLELQALESSIIVAVKVADSLVNLGYAILQRFETQLLEDQDSTRKSAKVVLTLVKAESFDKASEDWESKKSQNE